MKGHGMDNGISREAIQMSQIRYLERQLDVEKSKAIFAIERRKTAEAKIDLLKSEYELHIKKLQEQIADLRNEVSQIKRQKAASIESSKQYQKVVQTLVAMTDMRDALQDQIKNERKAIQHQNDAQRKAMVEGNLEIKKQLQANIDEALLPSARKEYYSRYLKNLDLKNLMVLHQHMRFFDDQN
jgi:hypothetical protein